MDTLQESSDALKQKYEAVQARLHNREAERAELVARGEAIPRRLEMDLAEYRTQADEYRLWGHRAMVRELEEAQKAAQRRTLHERIEAEWRRIREAPPVAPEDIRRRREELGASQQRLAAFSGVNAKTIGRIETGFRYYKPMTLQYIAAGLQALEEHQKDRRPV